MRLACLATACLLVGCQPAAPVPAPAVAAAATPPPAVAPPRGPDALVGSAPAAATRAGSIAGTLSYPSEYVPPMRVCAFELADATAYCVRTGKHQARYRLDGVPPGDYLVLAFPQEAGALPGGYTGCVRDLTAACGDHELQPIVVAAGRTTPDIDPADYYADAADWPQEPTP